MCPKNRKIDKCSKYLLKPYYLRSPGGGKVNISTVFNRIFQENLYFRIFLMARFGPRAYGPLIFGPGQAGPIYKRRTGPKRARPRPDPSLSRTNFIKKIFQNRCSYLAYGRTECDFLFNKSEGLQKFKFL